jgi:Tol biopolymer transport system component
VGASVRRVRQITSRFRISIHASKNAKVSSDGQWVAYHSNESGRFEVYVKRFPDGEGQQQISAAGGVQPRWRRDGKELYYVASDGGMMAAPIAINGTALEPGVPVRLFQTRNVGGGTEADTRQQ